MLIASGRAVFILAQHMPQSQKMCQEKSAASKNNLICGRFAADFTRTLRELPTMRVNLKMSLSLGFRQGGGLFFE